MGETIMQVMATVAAKITEHGYTFIGVFDPERKTPGFVYTMGLTNRGWPELLLIGNLHPRIAEIVLTDLVRSWEAAGGPIFGENKDAIRFGDGKLHSLRVKSVAPVLAVSRYLCQLPHYVKPPTGGYHVAQVMWPDADDRFPTHSQYDTKMVQPVLPGPGSREWTAKQWASAEDEALQNKQST